jgi:hypothetical protein
LFHNLELPAQDPCVQVGCQQLRVALQLVEQLLFLISARVDCDSGLPDGLFSNQNYQFGEILEGLRLENVYIFHGHLKYIVDILWDIL